MNDKKKEALKEITSLIKNFSTLILSGICLYFGISIAPFIFNTKDEKLIWLIDLGIFNFIFAAIVSLIFYKCSTLRTQIEIKILNSEENHSVITLKEGISKKILVKISAKGNRKNVADKVVINFPDWLDVQVKSSEYIVEDPTINQYEIDLQKIFTHQNHVDQTHMISMDIINNSPEQNEIHIVPEIAGLKIKRKIFLKRILKGISIKLRGN